MNLNIRNHFNKFNKHRNNRNCETNLPSFIKINHSDLKARCLSFRTNQLRFFIPFLTTNR